MLGDIERKGEKEPLDVLFHSLEETAQEDNWEVKRRIAEALPKLAGLQPEAALHLASLLRQDYHIKWRADIRRRVVEAVPDLYPHSPEETLKLLSYRERDEVYTAMATVEVLYDLENSTHIEATTADQYFQNLHLEAVHLKAITYLRQLLQRTRKNPDAALADMNANREHPERIFRICIQRVAPRLLESRSEQSLNLISYFLRRDESGQPAEHQNLRRPVSKALPEILNLLVNRPDLVEKVASLLQMLATDPDIHVRRALSDTLNQLALADANLVVAVLQILIEDQDPYVRQRAWRVLLQLSDLYPEQAAEYYKKVLN